MMHFNKNQLVQILYYFIILISDFWCICGVRVLLHKAEKNAQ